MKIMFLSPNLTAIFQEDDCNLQFVNDDNHSIQPNPIHPKLTAIPQDEEDEDDEIERLIKAAEKERAALLEKPVPAPPPR